MAHEKILVVGLGAAGLAYLGMAVGLFQPSQTMFIGSSLTATAALIGLFAAAGSWGAEKI